MKVHSNFTGPKSKKRLIAFSCATALASFAFIAKPAFAEEAKADNASNLDTTAATTANVETTADLVETKVVEAPVTTENVASTENTTNVSEQATTSVASSETTSETALTTVSESQAPAESAAGQTREAVTTDRAASEAASATADTNSETNVTGGQYYSDSLGNWYYKDASGKNLTGAQKIDGINVYFDENGIQVKGNFSKNKQYYDADSGALVTDCYINHLGGVYYVDKNGEPLKGAQTIQGKQVYFNDYNGLQVRDGFASNEHFYDKDGNLVTDSYVFSTKYNYNNTIYPFYVDKNGDKLKGEQIINGKSVYFDKYDGAQVRNSVADNGHFYDQDGNLVDLGKKHYVFIDNHWFYIDEDGKILKGEQVIDGVKVYFNPYYGYQIKGDFNSDGQFYDKDTGELVTNRYIQLTRYESNGSMAPTLETHWYYLGSDGKVVTGPQVIDGVRVYINYRGHQAKGDFGYDGYYYDKDTGALVKNSFVSLEQPSGTLIYYLDNEGNTIKGEQIINGKHLNFGKYGIQVKGNFAPNGLFYDAITGEPVTNRYVQINDQSNSYNTLENKDKWFYIGSDSKALKGEQVINGVTVFFDKDGVQAKGIFADDGFYYDKDSGARVNLGNNQFVQVNGNWYYLNNEGKIVKGEQVIDGNNFYFDKDGKQVKGNFAENGAYYDENSGVQVTNRYVNFNNNWYRIGAKGTPLKGAHVVDGHNVFFDQDGKQIKGDFASDGYYYSKNSGDRVDLGQNHYQNINNNWYYIGNDGKRLTGEQVIDGVEVYFDSTGKQVKGNFAENDSFYDKDSGARLKEQFVDLNGKTYYVDAKGKRLREGGVRTINGKEYTFTGGADPHLAREEFLYPYGYSSFYDLNNKEVKGPQFVKAKNGNRYYITASGHVPLGLHIINGELYMFDAPTNKYADGRVSANGLTKDYFPSLIPNGSHIYYFDKETATAIKNQYKEVNGNWYYFGPNWYALTGEQTIDGAHVYFHRDGKQAKGELVTVNDKLHYYDPNSGARTENTTLTIEGKTYHFDAEGNGKLLN